MEYKIGLDLKFICSVKAIQLYVTLLSNFKNSWGIFWIIVALSKIWTLSFNWFTNKILNFRSLCVLTYVLRLQEDIKNLLLASFSSLCTIEYKLVLAGLRSFKFANTKTTSEYCAYKKVACFLDWATSKGLPKMPTWS